MYFIMYFIIVAIGAIIYNFLQPKIGGIKTGAGMNVP
jgi:hypothetical protein